MRESVSSGDRVWLLTIHEIGINYKGQENELRGCINDAKRVREFLISEECIHSWSLARADDPQNMEDIVLKTF